ncbi:hypothetical protein TIFTF001_027002 [Ficus carica]|uniref:Uncharacterized protein n=1 Tax=Ficus carica TaxID=3494 RepID=A0AA88DMJ4_FICCA|nr:hypothetical protein TIFTF001_027002 [Ficus carica]
MGGPKVGHRGREEKREKGEERGEEREKRRERKGKIEKMRVTGGRSAGAGVGGGWPEVDHQCREWVVDVRRW